MGLFEVKGTPLRGPVASAMYEICVPQEWARANHLTGAIKLSDYSMGTTMDRTLVDSGEGTCQPAHQFNGYFYRWYCHRVREGKEPGTVRVSGADDAHQEHCHDFSPHGAD